MSTALAKKALGARERLSEGDWVQGSRSRGEGAREGPCVGDPLLLGTLGHCWGAANGQASGLGTVATRSQVGSRFSC